MLGKLIKHEFNATYMRYMVLYTGVIIFAILNKIFWLINTDNLFISVIKGFITFIYVLAIIAVFVMTIVFTIQRFYKNLIKEEGYLSFTLPVGTAEHIFSKLIVSFVWTVLSFIAVGISLLIMAFRTDAYSSFSIIWHQVQVFLSTYQGVTRLIVEVIILVIISVFYVILMFYASMALGQLFSKHKIGGSILGYIGLYIVTQICSSLVMTVGMVGSPTYKRMLESNLNPLSNEGMTFFSNLFLASIILQLVLSVAYFLITYFIFKKNLNLE
jgi:hypothetical protein